MHRYGNDRSALIETSAYSAKRFRLSGRILLVFLARSLKVPLSKAYGVATFYNHFRLKPQGDHTCVVCMGTACYIKGASKLLYAVEVARISVVQKLHQITKCRL